MHQCGRLQSLTGSFPGDSRRCQYAQLVIDERQQLSRRLLIPAADSGEDFRHISRHPIHMLCSRYSRFARSGH
jgi:hypothetical protein